MKKVIKFILMFFGVLAIIGIIAAALSNSKTTKSAGSTVVQTKAASTQPQQDQKQDERPELEIIKQSASSEVLNDETIVTVHVQVQNNTNQLKDYVQVSATFYDKAGKIVGTAMGNTMNLAAGAKRTIDVVGMDIEKSDHYEVEVADHPM
jgi:cytoskeletal protein RodZ